MNTRENLKRPLPASQANRTYLAFGERAQRDGFAQVAKLFRAVAAAETIHAHAHLRAMDGSRPQRKTSWRPPPAKYEFEQMYPPMVATAEAEGDRRATMSMRYAMRWRRSTMRCSTVPWSRQIRQ